MAFKMKGHTLPGPNKMKSPVKDKEAITGNKHPHIKPKTSTRGIHTDKHGNKTGQVK